jgi:hypothetical protein
MGIKYDIYRFLGYFPLSEGEIMFTTFQILLSHHLQVRYKEGEETPAQSGLLNKASPCY